MSAIDTAENERRQNRMSLILSFYIARIALSSILLIVAAFAVLAFLIDLIENLRSISGIGQSMLVAVELTLFHVPTLLDRLWPFAMLFGGMLAFYRLARRSELVVIRASGVSVWQFLFPAALTAALLGALVTTALSPFTAALAAHHERLSSRAFGNGDAEVAVFPGGFWLRQASGTDSIVIRATALDPDTVELREVIAFVYDADDVFVRRIDAPAATLEDGIWRLPDARASDAQSVGIAIGTFEIPTNLVPETIRESLQSPKTLSFWDLPAYIRQLQQLGFPGREHVMQWHSLLAQPAFFTAMLVVGVTFTLDLGRRGGVRRLLLAGLLSGFLLFIAADVVRALGLSGQVPPAVAAWTPTLAAMMLAASILLRIEDG